MAKDDELGIRNFTQAAGSGDAYLAAYANISQTTNAYRSARSSAARAAAMTTAKVVVDESGNVTPTA